MSTLKIWETVRATELPATIRLDERVTYQTVTFTAAAGTSAAFDGDTTVLAIIADVACAVRVGANPTAVVTDYPIVASVLSYIMVQPGQKISVIAT